MSQKLEQIKRRLSPRSARAFEAAIADVRSGVVLQRLTDSIDRGDLNAALDALNLDVAAFSGFTDELARAFNQAGLIAVSEQVWRNQSRQKVTVRWDLANTRANSYITSLSSELVTSLIDGQLVNVRSAILNGYQQGQGPRQIALDIVGRIGPNGKRQGGVLGLDDRQLATRARVIEALQNNDAAYLKGLSSRDRRLDAMLDRGNLTAFQRERWLTAHTNKALKNRGDRIARTETATAVERGRYEAFQQGLGKTGYPNQAVVKTWLHGGGGMQPRDTHVMMHRVSVTGLDTPFTLPDGRQMQYPLDPDGGAHNVVNCTCSQQIKIDYGYGL